MTLSELCIRRPVMTVLLSIATVIAGTVAYLKIPVAALPSFNSPVISVSASLPGASPENVASAVALALPLNLIMIEILIRRQLMYRQHCYAHRNACQSK